MWRNVMWALLRILECGSVIIKMRVIKTVIEVITIMCITSSETTAGLITGTWCFWKRSNLITDNNYVPVRDTGWRHFTLR